MAASERGGLQPELSATSARGSPTWCPDESEAQQHHGALTLAEIGANQTNSQATACVPLTSLAPKVTAGCWPTASITLKGSALGPYAPRRLNGDRTQFAGQ